jgi:hypothetical protein
MTNDPGAKSQSNPNDQAPNPKGRGSLGRISHVWNLVIVAWDLIGIWLLGHWDFGSVSFATGNGCPQL